MTKANITQYDSTPSNNADINDINIAENCPASNINNAIRELMAHLKNVDTGSQALTALSVTGALSCGAFTSNGIDDNADATAITIDSSENVAFSGNISVDNKVQGASGQSLTIESQSGGAVIINTNGASEKARLTSGGAFLVGVTDASPFVATEGHVVALNDGTRYGILTGCDHIGNREAVAFVNPNGQVGSINTNGSATSFNTSSDHRIKENVEDMTGAIDRVKQLLPKRFNFIADETDTLVDGFLAHEAQSVVAEAVHGTHNEVDDDGNPVMQGIDQSKLVPLLTGALKEAIAKIEALETRITALENA